MKKNTPEGIPKLISTDTPECQEELLDESLRGLEESLNELLEKSLKESVENI